MRVTDRLEQRSPDDRRQRKIYRRYVWAGLTRNADRQADLFTADGVIETPLLSSGHAYPRRMGGREAIRAGLAAWHERPTKFERALNTDRSRYELHSAPDPDVFVVEIDGAFDGPMTMSLVQIFQ